MKLFIRMKPLKALANGFVIRIALLVYVVMALGACYPVGHRHHTEDEHAESMRRMDPRDPPNADYVERW